MKDLILLLQIMIFNGLLYYRLDIHNKTLKKSIALEVYAAFLALLFIISALLKHVIPFYHLDPDDALNFLNICLHKGLEYGTDCFVCCVQFLAFFRVKKLFKVLKIMEKNQMFADGLTVHRNLSVIPVVMVQLLVILISVTVYHYVTIEAINFESIFKRIPFHITQCTTYRVAIIYPFLFFFFVKQFENCLKISTESFIKHLHMILDRKNQTGIDNHKILRSFRIPEISKRKSNTIESDNLFDELNQLAWNTNRSLSKINKTMNKFLDYICLQMVYIIGALLFILSLSFYFSLHGTASSMKMKWIYFIVFFNISFTSFICLTASDCYRITVSTKIISSLPYLLLISEYLPIMLLGGEIFTTLRRR